MLLTCKHKTFFTVFKRAFIYNIYHVTTEAHDTSVEPKSHNILDFLHDLGVIPIEIGLFF